TAIYTLSLHDALPIFTTQTHRRDPFVQHLTRAADERAALEVFVFPRSFADEENLRIGVALAEHRISTGFAEPATRAAADFAFIQRGEAGDLFFPRQKRRIERLHRRRRYRP